VKEFGEIGRRAGDNLDAELMSGRLDISGLKGRLNNLNAELVKAEQQLNRERHKEAENEWKRHLAHIAALEEDALRDRRAGAELQQAYTLNRLFDMRREIQMQRDLALVTRAFRENEQRDTKRLTDLYRETRNEIELMQQGERRHSLTRHELLDNLRKVNDEMERNGTLTRATRVDIDRHRDALLRMHPTLNVYRKNLLDISDATGAAFGRGSRNNFLNFVGSVARNVVRLGASLFDLAGYFGGLGRRIVDAGSLMGGFAVMAKELGKVGGIAVAGLGGLFAVIGPLISILSELGGIFLALAGSMGGALLGAVSSLGSTLAFSLGGGIAIAATGLIPLVAGIGVFALAIKNADKDTKNSLKSIGDSFDGLGAVAAESTFGNIDEQARRFKAVLGDLSPLVSNIGRAISLVGDNWLTMMEGQGFKQFRAALEDFLPGAVAGLGITIGNIAGGLGGVFRAAIPEASNFLGWLQRITAQFSNWANSFTGQSEMASFFRRASDSAAELGGFLLALTGLFSELFDQANQPGNRLFSSMTEGLENMTRALDENPDIMQGWIKSMEDFGGFLGSVVDLFGELLSAGQEVGDSLFRSMSTAIDGWVTTLRQNPDILRDWYKSAESFAEVIGEVAVGFGKVFDALDNEFSRGVLIGVFEGLSNAIEIVSTALETVAGLFGDAGSKALGFAGQIAGATFALGLFSKAVPTTAIATFVGNLKNVETRAGALQGAIKPLLGAGGILALGDALQGAADKGTTFGGVLQGVAGGAMLGAMFGPIGALIGGAAGGGLTALAGAFGDTAEQAKKSAETIARMDGMKTAKEDADSLREALVGVANAYGETARAAVEASFTGEDGKLDKDIAKLRELGVSMDTIVSAAMGQADAQRIVNDALGTGTRNAESYAERAKQAYLDAKDGIVEYRDAQGNVLQQRETPQHIAELKADWERAKQAAVDAAVAAGTFDERIRQNGITIAEHRTQMKSLADQLGINVKQYKDFPKEVRTRFEADGLPQIESDALRLIRSYDGLQNYKSIKAVVSAPGVDLTRGQVEKLAKQYELTPKQVRTLLRQEGAESTKKAIEGVTDSAKNLDKQKPKPKITVDTGQAVKDTAAVKKDLEYVGGMHEKPKITVDPGASMGTIGGIKSGIAGITDKTVTIRINTVRTGPGGQGDGYAPTAVGGTFMNAQRRLIGEAGPEAVVPLARNLNLVDPSVRWLSAIAQGKMMPAAGPTKTISADNWTIVSNSKDPAVVARETFDQLAGAGY
jgi:hypothetical protein